MLGPVTVDVTLDGTTTRHTNELVLVGHSGTFAAEGIELALSGGVDIVNTPMWLEAATGPDWLWVSQDL